VTTDIQDGSGVAGLPPRPARAGPASTTAGGPPGEPAEVEVAVIGAGQAGLSAAYFLQRAAFESETGFVVLDADPAPGGAWQHRWPSLRFGMAHRIYALPGLPLSGADETAPAAAVVSRYFAEYESRFALPVHRPVRVSAVRPAADGRLLVETDSGDWAARAVVNATGTWTKPFWPHYPGMERFRGRQLHTVDYRGAEELAGRHVVVVGGGNSAVQLLAEISAVTTTTWVTRREPRWREGAFDEQAGREAVALVEQAVREGRPPGSVVSVTGLAVTPAVAAARDRGALRRLPMFDRITPDGVSWDDGRFVRADAILWCTGFRAALGHLAPLHLRGPGGGIRMAGTRVAKEPRLHLVGYGPSASTIGANRAGRAAVRELRELLGRQDGSAALQVAG
jgi:thioredoxin reductase